MERNRKGDIYSLQSRKITNRYPSSLLKSNRRTTTQATKLPNDIAVKSLLPRNIADEVVLRKKRKKFAFILATILLLYTMDFYYFGALDEPHESVSRKHLRDMFLLPRGEKSNSYRPQTSLDRSHSLLRRYFPVEHYDAIKQNDHRNIVHNCHLVYTFRLKIYSQMKTR